MSLDGAFIHRIKRELIERNLIGGRVDKIHQPSRDEIIVSIRIFGGDSAKILFSANSAAPRANITDITPENPKSPPMFCMLMRKHLGGGKLIDISQDGLERILNFDFECTNEIGDIVVNRLVIEIMGKYSNIILLAKKENEYRVIDSIRRVTDDVSSVRRILPNIVYELPPRESRFNLLDCDFGEVRERLAAMQGKRLVKALIELFEGISPIFARECAYACSRDVDVAVDELDDDRTDKLIFFLKKARAALNGEARYVVVSDTSGKPKDFCFINIEQYGASIPVKEYESANELLDGFYRQKSEANRMHQRSGSLLRSIMNAYERTARKLELQRQELEQCAEREVFRVRGDLINANIYRLEKGMTSFEAENYYTGQTETIPLDVRLTPAQNAQKCYSEYKKLDTAEKMLRKFIEQGENELIYIDSVFDEASRVGSGAGSERELEEIRQELYETGYLRRTKGSAQKQQKALPPMKFVSSDGFEIFVGRNNVQNDKLTLKTARPNDTWLHTQNIAGSHVIISGENIPDSTLEEAASLAAYCSKARGGTKIPVDYTLVRYVKKPNGAKPGMVIFTNNKTILVDADEEIYNKLRVQN